MGRSPFSDEQKAGFIARQLVETSQGTKGVANILRQLLPGSKIVYAKASNVSEFRHTRDDIPKSRLVNDFHHAHDAYLNIVVGNVYYVKFTQNPLNFIKKDYDKYKEDYNLSKMFDWDVKRNGEVAWIAQRKDGEAGTITTVKRMLSRNTPLMTRYSFEGKGGLANETLCSAKKAKGEGYIPFKSSDDKMQDVTKYGGFTKVTGAYFFLVEHAEKKKRIRTIESVPVYLAQKIEQNPDELKKYCEEILGLVDADIRLKKIKIGSLIKRNGYFCYITGKTGNRLSVRNAVNLCLKNEWIKYISKLEKVKEKDAVDEIITKEKNEVLYSELIQKFKHGIFSKRPNPVEDKLEKGSEKFSNLSIKEQCAVLCQILQLAAVLGSECDMTLLGESAHCGKMLISKKIGDEEIYLLNQSVTGLYEKKINLHTV